MEIATIKRGESFTFKVVLNAEYDMARLKEYYLYIGGRAMTGTVNGNTITVKLRSEDTDLMSGINKITLWLDDTILGVQKPYLGDMVVSMTNAGESNSSVSEVDNALIPVTITATAITVGDILYNYVKGDKGDPFLYSDFTPEQLEALKVKGDKGDPFLYEDFTPEQLEALKVKGDTGNGIQSITLLSTVGLVKTYRVTYTDGTTYDYTVTDGASTPIVQTTGTSTTDVMSQKAVTDELALKEATANKQNSLTPDGTGTKFPTVDAVNAGLAGVSNLLASYTHTGNKEVQTTAVDLATGTFTAVGHGLNNADMIFPILNLGYLEAGFGIIRPFPTGLVLQRYFVVEKTDDTFKVAVSAGGAAVVFTSNTFMDLTKWHFEKKNVATVIISNITERNTRIVFTGWVLYPFLVMSPSIDGSGFFGSKSTFIGTGTTVPAEGAAILTYEGYAHVVRDTRIGKHISSLFSGVIVKKSTVSANSIAELDAKVVSLYYADIATTNVIIGHNASSSLIVNGTEVKIYKL